MIGSVIGIAAVIIFVFGVVSIGKSVLSGLFGKSPSQEGENKSQDLLYRIITLEEAVAELKRRLKRVEESRSAEAEPKREPETPPFEVPITKEEVFVPPDVMISKPEVVYEGTASIGELAKPVGGVAQGYAPASSVPDIDWENFFGVKLFAWLGGFALFLGVAFFVKYSIDHSLVSPLMRVIIGFAVGLIAIVSGLFMRDKGYETTVQTLCAAGISIFYADIFACKAVYNFIPSEMAFLFMALVTAASFLLAVRLDSKYVALLGLIGGFLTPPLLSTGEDRALALFAYCTMLDIGIAAVALRKNWGFLIGLSALATLGMEAGWTAKFFMVSKVKLASSIYLFFPLFYAAISKIAEDRNEEDSMYGLTANFFALFSMGFAANMLQYHDIAGRPGIVLSYLLLMSVILAWRTVRSDDARGFHLVGGLFTFVVLWYWNHAYLTAELLYWGLGFDFAFAILHMVCPLILQNRRPTARPFLWGYLAGPLVLVLIIGTVLVTPLLTFMIWPFLFVIGLAAVLIAWMASIFWIAAASIILLMVALGTWTFRLPNLEGLSGALGLIVFFALSFFAVSLYITKKKWMGVVHSAASGIPEVPDIDADWSKILPAFSVFPPFILLAAVAAKLPISDPTQIFGIALLMTVLLMALARYRSSENVLLAGLAGTCLVEYAWHFHSFNPLAIAVPLYGYGLFCVIFTLFPFVFRERLKTFSPWMASALSGPAHFFLVYKAVDQTFGKDWIGAVPALLAALSLISLYKAIRSFPKEEEHQRDRLALFGGVALLFITLIIPLQLEKQWVTLGWVLEGTALLWLNKRVEHKGLVLWGTGLLIVSFARLALNPAVLSYHPRTDTPILNWYLYVYITAIVSLWLSANLIKGYSVLSTDTNKKEGSNTFRIMAGVLAFLILNIEIADYFSTGSAITFNFSGNIAQDMTYSLGWAAFAVALLLIGIRSKNKGARMGSLILLTVTIFKVFLHDLWRLGQLYRVASIVGLALVLILVSFLYQKFIAKGNS